MWTGSGYYIRGAISLAARPLTQLHDSQTDMKIVIISDTHAAHENLGLLEGDVLIHCGDLEHLFQQDTQSIKKIDKWFGLQKFEHILCIGGNHDLSLEIFARNGKQPFRNATFLHDHEIIIDGIKFYGSPWVPHLSHHAFYANSDAIREAWSKIPDDVDVLITHTPPARCLDVSSRGMSLGCDYLAQRLKSLRPLLHCFGHVHASVGQCQHKGITFVNAASVNSQFEISNPPVVFNLINKT